MKKYLFVLLACIACTNQFPTRIVSFQNASFAIYDNWTVWESENDHWSIDNIFANTIDKADEIQMSVHALNIACSPSLTGVSKPTNIGEESEWGKVDAWEIAKRGGRPFNFTTVLCQEGAPKPTSQYAFCSEKNGKTVVICLSQMTDDPKMAEEIFNTFRWVK